MLHSPNFSSRGEAAISLLVLHYTGMRSSAEAIARLCDANAQVSAHYVVDEDGAVYPLVAEEHCAWHAGVSYWRGFQNVNPISVGIEIVNPGHEFGYRPFPAAQMEAVAALSQAIIQRHAIKPYNIVGHSDIAPLRKEDPGELFDWSYVVKPSSLPAVIASSQRLRGNLQPMERDCRATLGVTAGGEEFPGNTPLPVPIQKLYLYGYQLPDNQADYPKIAVAFQRHFRQRDISGIWDSECEEILAHLLQVG